MLVSKTRRVDIPHEEGEWVELKELSGRKLRQNRERQTWALLAKVNEAGGFGALKGVEAPEGQKPDPLAAYDLGDLLEKGIVAWSYGEELTPEAIECLDEETERFIACQLIPGAEDDSAVKKGS